MRSSFLDFFAKNGHERLPSASLIPQNDPTLMFVAAGMVPFKDVFTGKEPRRAPRITTSQKCIRISGKHNDLENVGVTARHHTFFEMLGNFSFGDYFKEEAIKMAWDLISKEWQIPQDRLCVTVFGGEAGLEADHEARALWKKISGLPDERIIDMGAEENFWSAGETGPCGPCTEIHFFHGKDGAPPTAEELRTFGQVEPDHRGYGWMEIWNLVFMQYERSLDANGVAQLAPLPKPCVDTGAGLERVASVLQGKTSNYDTDLLSSLVHKAASIAGKSYGATLADDDVSLRVIADHARTTAFLIAEGIHPDRTGRSYVLRRVMRRAIRHGHRLGIQKPFLHEVALSVVDSMGDVYPELVQRRAVIADVAEQEEVRFRETIERGLKLLDEEVNQMRGRGQTIVSGDVAFKLYDTFGFPLDLTEVIARERDLTVDQPGYDRALEAQRSRSEGSKVGDEAVADVFRALAEAVPATKFLGYEREEAPGRVLALATQTGKTDAAEAGQRVFVVVDQTPFYAESGGQVGDAGTLVAEGVRVRIDDVQKPTASVFVLSGQVLEGTLRVGAEVDQRVDNAQRSATRRNHSATHLLHWALRKVLGDQAAQKGSMVGPERLRFDFSYGKPLTADEIASIELLVNRKILENAPIQTEVLPIEEARAKGAVAMFGEKYGDVVRVLTMTSDSVEFCGGTHARALGDIGLFKILSDAGIAAGVRRIEAATGLNALSYLQKVEGSLAKVARTLKSSPDDVGEKVERLFEQNRTLEKELAEAKKKAALGGGSSGGGVDGMLAQAKSFGDAKALAVRLDDLDAKTARELADQLRDRLGNAAVLVASSVGGKAQLVVTVAKTLSDRAKAGDLVRDIAKVVSGSGGGRPDMAQAGGTDPGQIPAAMELFYGKVGEALGHPS